MVARSYLRASTDEQDATRARAAVESFAAEHGLNIVGKYVENESGAKLARPELFRLIADSRPDDVLLIEQVDRLSRLTAADWQSSAPILTPSKSVSLRSIFRQVGCWRVRPTTSPGACSGRSIR